MKVLFAVKIGDESWQEQLITEGDAAKIEKASAWAKSAGFDRLRVFEVSDEPQKPDFSKVLNKGTWVSLCNGK